MAKRTHKEVMLAILKVLSDGKEHSYGNLERKVNTNWESIRNHCEILEMFEGVRISKENRVMIEDKGKNLLKKFS